MKLLKEIIAYLLIKTNRAYHNSEKEILSIFFHDPNKHLFEKIIKWLSKHNYRIISIEDLETAIQKRKITGKSAIITFDDGWKGNLKLLDSIKKYQIPITIFIPTEPVTTGNYWFEFAKIKGQKKISKIKNIKGFKSLPATVLNKKIEILKNRFFLKRSCLTLAELKEIAKNDLITIGSHTVNHPILTQCTPEMQEYELSKSKTILQEWIKKDIQYFAYPNGDYNSTSITTAKNRYYKLCFTIVPEKINIEKVDPFQIPRCCIDDNGGYFESIAKVLGLWQKCFPK